MFKYTIAAYHKIINDLKLLAHLFTVVVQSLMVVYMTYSAIVSNGSRAINITLGSLTLLNLVVYLITYGRNDRKSKKVKGAVSRAYVVTKLSLNAISLVSIVYSIYVGASNVSGFTMVITPLMIIMWVLQVLFQLAKAYVENRFALFVDGIQMDIEFVANPIRKVKNAVHDFLGEERESEDVVSERSKKILMKQAETDDIAKKEKRAAKSRKLFSAIGSRLGRRAKAVEIEIEENEETTV